MANSKKVIVAIDPDVQQSGVAQIQDGVISVFRMSLIGIVEYLQTLKICYSHLKASYRDWETEGSRKVESSK